jgi:hypothetical protein
VSAPEGNSRAKPGASTQFKKGQSGNPKGRPRKNQSSGGRLPTELAELVKSETERLLTLTDAGKPVTMSALQAVLRATVVSAARGNPHAQRTVLQLAGAAQAQAARAKSDEYQAAILLKIQLDHERDVWLARGRSETDMPRHSSDIEINLETLEVKYFLLFTREEIEGRRRAIELRDYLLQELPRMLLAASEEGDDFLFEMGRNSAAHVVDRLNAALAPRFRRFLPGDVRPLAATASPKEIWHSMTGQLASALMKKPG